MSHAVCYVASGPGYLFPTMVSATQARRHAPDDVEVIVVFFGTAATDDEEARFARAADVEGVRLIGVRGAALGGLPPMFARLLLDTILPDDIDQILYLDGDTQVVGDLTPLIQVQPSDHLLAVRDPMVFTSRASSRMGRDIAGWWDESGIPVSRRDHYVNSGVMRLSRSLLTVLRDRVLTQDLDRLSRLHFLDQDAINLAADDGVRPVSMAWNFPGYLLGTPLEHLCRPRVLHFMSNPRPWNASLPPWGRRYHEPYGEFARRHPNLRQYWHRFAGTSWARYALQQRIKWCTEGHIWHSRAASRAVFDLEQDVVAL